MSTTTYMPRLFIVVLALAMGLGSCTPTTSDSKTTAVLTQYSEPHRPQFHFTPDSMWMNDPNGMVYLDGEYHLFYQFYPDSNVWGPMHWGHAVSQDMVRWEHLPIALYPDSLGLIFSGSAVIDHTHTSGLGKDGQAPMVAIFTHHNMAGEKAQRTDYQTQSIAYSLDKGRTWTKYAGNPVIANPGIKDFRDPKVIWHAESERWVMVLAAYDRAQFYTSPNLIDWTFASEFGIEGDKRLWECPDLFPMQVAGTGETKWVLITSIQQQAPNGGTATSYFVGDFDGKTFVGDPNDQRWLDTGTDNYAMVTWSNIPKEDGRTLAIGWMSNWQYAQIVPTERWRSAMTLPRSLTLHQVGDSYEIWSLPVKEVKTLHASTQELPAQTFSGTQPILTEEPLGLYEINLSFKRPAQGSVGLTFSHMGGEQVTLGFDADSQRYFIDRTRAGIADFEEGFAALHTTPVKYEGETVQLHILLDKSSVEMFADGGRCVMTDIFFPESPYTEISLMASGTEAELVEGKIIRLKGIWEAAAMAMIGQD